MRYVSSDEYEKLAAEVADQFHLNALSDHGLLHWRRVYALGKHLSTFAECDMEVVALFSLIHDSQRIDESDDPLHGSRAAQYARKLYAQDRLGISQLQLEQLVYACTHHSDPHADSDDVTIQVCWDADRLDLYRVGIELEDALLYTQAAKTWEVKEFAKTLTVGNSFATPRM